MSDRLDRIETNLEKCSEANASLSTDVAVLINNVNAMTELMKVHVRDDIKEHVEMKKDIKKNDRKLTFYAGGVAVILVVAGVLVKVLMST